MIFVIGTSSTYTCTANVINILGRKYAVLQAILKPQESLKEFAGRLREEDIIGQALTQNPNYDDIIGSFTNALPLLPTIDDIEKHCQKFIDSLGELGGPATRCASALREEWKTALHAGTMMK